MPDITIITDASVDAPTGIAGWCMWAKGHGRSSITRSGVLRTRVRSSVEAEFLAEGQAAEITMPGLTLPCRVAHRVSNRPIRLSNPETRKSPPR